MRREGTTKERMEALHWREKLGLYASLRFLALMTGSAAYNEEDGKVTAKERKEGKLRK